MTENNTARDLWIGPDLTLNQASRMNWNVRDWKAWGKGQRAQRLGETRRREEPREHLTKMAELQRKEKLGLGG